MEQLQRLPDQVEGLLKTLESLREDLFDNHIGFVRKKIGQIVRDQSEGSFSNLNNYLIAVQRIAENCQRFWQKRGMTEFGYQQLHQQLTGLIESLNPVIAAHREHPEEIRKTIHSIKVRLSTFLGFFTTHATEARRTRKVKPIHQSKEKKLSQKTSSPSSQTIARTPQQRVWRAFERLDEENKRRGAM